MGNFLNNIINIGIIENQSMFEHRRIRLVNLFSLISAMLMVVFGGLNLYQGANFQGLIILSGILYISLPPIYFNKIGKYRLSRHYFIATSIIFIDIVTFRALFNFQNRHNEVFLVGYSAIIVVLCDNPAKGIFFFLTTLSTLVMITLRQQLAGLPIGTDTFMAYINTLVAFACVYFFIDIFKKEVMKNVAQLQEYSEELERHEVRIIRQRDEIFANRQLLRSAIDNIPVFIGLIDMQGKYLIANSLYATTFGLPISKIEGAHYTKVLPDGILNEHIKYIDEGLNGKEVSFEGVANLPNDNNTHVMGKYVPVFDAFKKQIALAVYVVDVTTLKDTEAKLVALNQTKNRILSIISHDVRSPLNSLRGLISVSDQISESDFRGFVNKVDKQLYNVTFNLDNLLNWSKGQMKGFTINPQPTDLVSLCHSTITLFEDQIKEKNLNLSKFINVTREYQIDKESIRLVLRNILSNAIKFTPKNGEIKCFITGKDDGLTIEIQDSGHGIEPDKIDLILTGAQTVKSNLGTEGEKGTGLGLSLCVEIVNKNNGQINISSTPENGTKVMIFIPENHP